MNVAELKNNLERDEGRKTTLYKDHLGVETFGVGHNAYKALSEKAVDQILDDDIYDAVRDLENNAAWWREMSEPRQRALCNMCFQMGWPRLSGFKKMLAALESGLWDEAASEALDSTWAKQTPERAKRVVDMIRVG